MKFIQCDKGLCSNLITAVLFITLQEGRFHLRAIHKQNFRQAVRGLDKQINAEVLAVNITFSSEEPPLSLLFSPLLLTSCLSYPELPSFAH